MAGVDSMCLAGHVVSSGATWCCNLPKGHDGSHDDGLGDQWDDHRGFPTHIIGAAFGPDALAATHRKAEQQRACICWDGNPENYEGADRDCPTHGEKADATPRWLAGLIARYGQPVTFQPEPIRLGACRYQTWAWVGLGVQVEQTLSAFTVSAHRKGRMAKLAGLTEYPTDAEISGVVALAGLDDAPEVVS